MFTIINIAKDKGREKGRGSSSWEEIGFVRSTAALRVLSWLFGFICRPVCTMQKWVKSMSEGRRFKKPYLLNFPSIYMRFSLFLSSYLIVFSAMSDKSERAPDDCDSGHSSTGNSHKRLTIQTSQIVQRRKEKYITRIYTREKTHISQLFEYARAFVVLS